MLNNATGTDADTSKSKQAADKKELSVREVIHKQGSACEVAWYYLGIAMALFTGMASPSFYIVFGAIIDSTGNRPDPSSLEALSGEQLAEAQEKTW